MSEVASVRSEIKNWERSFEATNGREPTVNDIKKEPAIAEKYKLYKRLSKISNVQSTQDPTSAGTSTYPSNPPSTPPSSTRQRTTDHHSVLSKRRDIERTIPLSSFNPFSPQKKDKGKQKVPASWTSNPFATPVKTKAKAKPPSPKRPLSPDPFPMIDPTATSSQTSKHPASAIARARKRLRGEPVSPSPNKNKRQRESSQMSLSFSRVSLDTGSSEDDEKDIFYVDDSPMKVSTEGKSFKVLFADAILPNGDIFGTKEGNNFPAMSISPQNRDMQRTTLQHQTRKSPIRAIKGKSSKRRKLSNSYGSSALMGGKASVTSMPPVKSKKSAILAASATSKRPLSDTEIETEEHENRPKVKPRLIPPSPPPAALLSRPQTKGKGKGNTSGKLAVGQMQLLNGGKYTSDSDETDELPTKVKIIDRTRTRLMHVANSGSDEDVFGSDLGYPRFTAPHGQQPTLALNTGQESKFEVDLPAKLLNVLAIQPAQSTSLHTKQDKIVKGLIHGRRVNNYDPNKGGEIWEVGEDDLHQGDDEVNRLMEDEDDWEGEPIPWEVGEL